MIRFWYETGDDMLRFTEEQLTEIRRSSLSGLLCRNCDDPGSLPHSCMDAMKPDTNPMVKCPDMNHIDLIKWRDDQGSA